MVKEDMSMSLAKHKTFNVLVQRPRTILWRNPHRSNHANNVIWTKTGLCFGIIKMQYRFLPRPIYLQRCQVGLLSFLYKKIMYNVFYQSWNKKGGRGGY
jgi:hypothetical protein